MSGTGVARSAVQPNGMRPQPPYSAKYHQRAGLRSRAEWLVRFSRYADAVIVAICFAAVWGPSLGNSRAEAVLALLAVPLWMELFRYFDFYQSHRLEGVLSVTGQVVSAQLVGGIVLAAAAVLVGDKHTLLRVGSFLALSTVILLLQKGALRAVLITLRRHGFDHRNVCLIGGWDVAEKTAAELQNQPGWGLHLVMVGVGSGGQRKYYEYHSRSIVADDLEHAMRKAVVDEVWIEAPVEALAEERPVMALCERYGILGRVRISSWMPEMQDADVASVGGSIAIGVGGLRHNDVAVAIKRVTDVLLACALLALTSPILLASAVLVKLSSRGPVLFSQTRVGLRGRRFRVFKIRTMINGAENLKDGIQSRNITGGPVFKDPHDPRITPIGRLLRRFSIDELPQLWNVIRGEMSMVGPRPLPVAEADSIGGTDRKRFSMRPGLTCLWQVSGRSDVNYVQWMQYDLQYVEHWSLWLDFSLLLRTFPVVLSGRGAY